MAEVHSAGRLIDALPPRPPAADELLLQVFLPQLRNARLVDFWGLVRELSVLVHMVGKNYRGFPIEIIEAEGR